MKLEIKRDEEPLNPRECMDPLGKMVCMHKRYSLGDKHDLKSSDFIGWDGIHEHLEKELDAVVILPLYLYDHSGITMSTNPFSCPWDSGQVGFIYVIDEQCKKEGFHKVKSFALEREQVEKILRSEVEEYDQYLRGDVWGYVITDDRGVQRDACWGIYGEDEARKTGEEALKVLEQQAAILLTARGVA